LTVTRPIEVDEIHPSTVPNHVLRAAQTPFLVNRSWRVGLAGTIVLHGLAASFFIPVTVTQKTSPNGLGGATVKLPRTTPADELVLVNIGGGPMGGDSASPGAASVDLQSQLTKLAILPGTPDPVTAFNLPGTDVDAENFVQSKPSPGDAELRARMFGRYTGQLSARIERAWDKPRSPVNDLSTDRSGDAVFVCKVQIRQDNQGNVQEVLLLACNGTEAWRHSLVVAINQSSPLPAPPIPAVFTRAITMTFEERIDQEGL
jgi:hypothetical protein